MKVANPIERQVVIQALRAWLAGSKEAESAIRAAERVLERAEREEAEHQERKRQWQAANEADRAVRG